MLKAVQSALHWIFDEGYDPCYNYFSLISDDLGRVSRCELTERARPMAESPPQKNLLNVARSDCRRTLGLRQ